MPPIKKNRLAFNGISNADFAQSFTTMSNRQFLLTILVCFFFLFCSFVTFKRTVNDRLSAPLLTSFSPLWVRRLYESGAYQIIFGKVAVPYSSSDAKSIIHCIFSMHRKQPKAL